MDTGPSSSEPSSSEPSSSEPSSSEPSFAAGDLLEQLEHLGGHLVWRVGKHEVSDEVVVRLGYASATPRFAHLPRLRSASDAELQEALDQNTIVIEWVD